MVFVNKIIISHNCAGLLAIFWICVNLNLSASLNSERNEALRYDHGKVVMCYWGTWAYYRRGDNTPDEKGFFNVTDIDPSLCTHLIYSFAGLHMGSNKINSLDPDLDLAEGMTEENPENPTNTMGRLGFLKSTVQLRDGNPNLKILIAIGGWGQESERFSIMAKSAANRAIFIQSIIDFIRKHDLDGIDMDWEYPSRRGGIAEDRQNFPIFLKELRGALDIAEPSLGRKLDLTSAFGCGKDVIDEAYDVPEIAKYIDYFNLMLYDFKMYSNETEEKKKIGHQSPLYYKPTESEEDQQLSSQWAVEYFIKLGAPPSKIVMGVGTYGRTYKLFSRDRHNFYDEAEDTGTGFAYTNTPGSMAYYEICLEIKMNLNSWEFSFDNGYKVPFAFNDNKWIGYDDEISAQEKVDFAMAKGLGGMMIWSLEQDDFRNHCEGWVKFPILTALNDRLEWHKRKNM